MSDILGETDGLGLVLYSGTRDDLQAKLRKRDDEITRLRSLLKEAGEALERLTTYATAPFDPFEAPDSNDWADAWDQSSTVLSKIKGEA
jgi:hypothetical protein